METMSILALFLLVGVASAGHIGYYDDDADDGPIDVGKRERRICTELCLSGLGGEPCGDFCRDLTPEVLARQSSGSGNRNSIGKRRQSVCPVLCANFLGHPLCNCSYNQQPPLFTPDVDFICDHFCTVEKYQLFGCACNTTVPQANVGATVRSRMQKKPKNNVDWNQWCQRMCKTGDGGAACYCDLLPMITRSRQ